MNKAILQELTEDSPSVLTTHTTLTYNTITLLLLRFHIVLRMLCSNLFLKSMPRLCIATKTDEKLLSLKENKGKKVEVCPFPEVFIKQGKS